MKRIRLIGKMGAGAGIVLVLATGITKLAAQRAGGGRTAEAVFTALDKNGDGTLTQSEIETGFNSWFTSWNSTNSGTLTRDQIDAGLSKVLPAPPATKP